MAAKHARLTTELAPVEEERAQLIRAAAAEGLTRRRIAALTGISFQRVQQIVSGNGSPANPPRKTKP